MAWTGVLSSAVARHILQPHDKWGKQRGRWHGSANCRRLRPRRQKGRRCCMTAGSLPARVGERCEKLGLSFPTRQEAPRHGAGPYPDISLAAARALAAEHRKQRHSGTDPLQARQPSGKRLSSPQHGAAYSANAPSSSSRRIGAAGEARSIDSNGNTPSTAANAFGSR